MEKDILQNPFAITKATEFSDKEINDYWINFSFGADQSVFNMLNPNEYLPKYILGGKGCGKTHLLRYFSFPLQKIRHNNNILDILLEDKYIGIYSVLNGIASRRFSGKGINDDIWNNLFEYYFELYISDNLLSIISETFSSINISKELQNNIVSKIKDIFHIETSEIIDFTSITTFLRKLRKKIDSEIVNAPFKRELDFEMVKILFSPGDLIFGIPEIITNNIREFKDVKFIFILDEYEKFFESQKVFINSLVFDKKAPCTFWIGARKYGFTTRKTKTSEPIRPGSEYQPVELDIFYKENEKQYKEFAKNLYNKRLVKFFESQNKYSSTKSDKKETYKLKFEKYTDDKLIEEINIKFPLGNYKHIQILTKRLKEGLKKKCIKGLDNDGKINDLIELLITNTENNPLLQKYKFFLFYQRWSKTQNSLNLFKIAEYVNVEFNKFIKEKPSEFDNIREKYKVDFLAQLASESNIKNIYYSDIEDFIDLSWGNPRVFLLILKIIIEKSWLRGEEPLLKGSLISLDSQFQGIYETARWFYEDAELIGDIGKNIYNAINNLADIFRVYRFSDKPSETSVSCFNFKEEDLTEETSKYIEKAALHSLIVEIKNGRKEKNSGRKQKVYQLNKTIAPLWNLPSARRGIVSFNKEMLNSIFNPIYHKNFDSLLKKKKDLLNAPFCSQKETDKTPTLF